MHYSSGLLSRGHIIDIFNRSVFLTDNNSFCSSVLAERYTYQLLGHLGEDCFNYVVKRCALAAEFSVSILFDRLLGTVITGIEVGNKLCHLFIPVGLFHGSNISYGRKFDLIHKLTAGVQAVKIVYIRYVIKAYVRSVFVKTVIFGSCGTIVIICTVMRRQIYQ